MQCICIASVQPTRPIPRLRARRPLEAGPPAGWDDGVDNMLALAIGFVSLLLLPALGVAGLVKQKVTPVLSVAVFAWLLAGVWALSTGWHAGLPEGRFLRLWMAGLTLGAGLLFVARLRERRKTWRWVRFVMTALTLAVFVKALMSYLATYT